MASSVAVCHDGSTLFESQFDPIELLGLRVPFVDPFRYDHCEVQASSSSMILPKLGSPVPARAFQECYQGPRHTVQLEDSTLGPTTPQEIATEQLGPVTVSARTCDSNDSFVARVRLSSRQAIHIFNQRGIKTKHTAMLLAAEYGISSKAIRDIWTGRSWSKDTRPIRPSQTSNRSNRASLDTPDA